jgi:WD40 repeat protein
MLESSKFAVHFAVSSPRLGSLVRCFMDAESRSVWVAREFGDVSCLSWDRVSLWSRSVLCFRNGPAAPAMLVSKFGAGEEEAATLVLSSDCSLRVWESDVCAAEQQQIATVRLDRAVLLSDGMHLAVCGVSSCDIEIVNLSTMSVVLTIPAGHLDWINVLCAVPPLGSSRLERRPPVLLSGSRDGMLIFWSLELAAGTPSAIPVGSLTISDSTTLKCAAVSPSARVLALVFENRVDFFKTLKPSLLHSVAAPPGCRFAGCSFASASRLMVWDDAGGGIVIELPRSYRQLPEPQFGPSTSVGQRNEQFAKRKPFLSASMDSLSVGHQQADVRNMSSPLSASSGRVSNKAVGATAAAAATATASATGNNNNEFHRAKSGVIFQRDEPPNELDELPLIGAPSALDETGPDGADVVEKEPEIVLFLSAPAECVGKRWVGSSCAGEAYCSVWEDGTVTLQGFGESEPAGPLSCRLVDEEEGDELAVVVLLDERRALLCAAARDGALRGVSLPEQRVQWRQALPHGPRAKVTALWTPGDSDLLVSGGSDFRVVVWKASTGAPLHAFSQHSAPIEHLIGPPKRDKRWKSCFLSVGGDAVCVLSLQNFNCQYVLGGHSSDLVSLVWRADQDFLVVGCNDGAVFVWELGTGSLVQRGERSARASEALNSGPNLLSARSQTLRRGPFRVLPHPRWPFLALDVRTLLDRTPDSPWTFWLLPWQVLSFFIFFVFVLKKKKDLEIELVDLVRSALGYDESASGPTHCALVGRAKNASVCLASARWRSSARLTAAHMTSALALVFTRLRERMEGTAPEILASRNNVLARLAGSILSGCSKKDVRGPSLALLAGLWQVSFWVFCSSCFSKKKKTKGRKCSGDGRS